MPLMQLLGVPELSGEVKMRRQGYLPEQICGLRSVSSEFLLYGCVGLGSFRGK